MEEHNKDMFEKLEGVMSHSDIYYLQIAADIAAALNSVADAFEDRNTPNATNFFKLSIITGIINGLFDIKLDTQEMVNLTVAYLTEATNLEPGDFSKRKGG